MLKVQLLVEDLSEELRVDKNSLLKVCLLIHLSKCITFVKNDSYFAKSFCSTVL
mgnify:CR=1 FL=1